MSRSYKAVVTIEKLIAIKCNKMTYNSINILGFKMHYSNEVSIKRNNKNLSLKLLFGYDISINKATVIKTV